jgi:hypothetical protein
LLLAHFVAMLVRDGGAPARQTAPVNAVVLVSAMTEVLLAPATTSAAPAWACEREQ